jgi:hypothetical protein
MQKGNDPDDGAVPADKFMRAMHLAPEQFSGVQPAHEPAVSSRRRPIRRASIIQASDDDAASEASIGSYFG